jgi:hypothetical protein
MQDYGGSADVLLQAIRRSKIISPEPEKTRRLSKDAASGQHIRRLGPNRAESPSPCPQDSNKKILKTLEVNNEVLGDIHKEFKTIVFIRAMKFTHSRKHGALPKRSEREGVLLDVRSQSNTYSCNIPPHVAENPACRHAGSDSTKTKLTTAKKRRKSRNRDIDPRAVSVSRLVVDKLLRGWQYDNLLLACTAVLSRTASDAPENRCTYLRV